MPHAVKVGYQAPDFTLTTETGQPFHLKELIGQKIIVLYFYPKDNTAVCTAQSCLFRDNYEAFQQAGAEVIGISSDSTESHLGFQQQHRLPFLLLSDPQGQLRKRYGVPKTLGILPGRVTYIIDRSGIVRYIFNSQLNAKAHIENALKIIQTLS